MVSDVLWKSSSIDRCRVDLVRRYGLRKGEAWSIEPCCCGWNKLFSEWTVVIIATEPLYERNTKFFCRSVIVTRWKNRRSRIRLWVRWLCWVLDVRVVYFVSKRQIESVSVSCADNIWPSRVYVLCSTGTEDATDDGTPLLVSWKPLNQRWATLSDLHSYGWTDGRNISCHLDKTYHGAQKRCDASCHSLFMCLASAFLDVRETKSCKLETGYIMIAVAAPVSPVDGTRDYRGLHDLLRCALSTGSSCRGSNL